MLRARHCQFCLDSIPATRRIDALYCRDSCKTLASHARKATLAGQPAPMRQQPSALVELVMRLESQEAAARSELAAMRVRVAELEALLHGGQTHPGDRSESSTSPAAERRASGRFKKREMKSAGGLPHSEIPSKDPHRGDATDHLLRTAVPTETPSRVDAADNLPLRHPVAVKEPQRMDRTEPLAQSTTKATQNLQEEHAVNSALLREDAATPAKNPREGDHVEALLRTGDSAKNPQKVDYVEALLRIDIRAGAWDGPQLNKALLFRVLAETTHRFHKRCWQRQVKNENLRCSNYRRPKSAQDYAGRASRRLGG